MTNLIDKATNVRVSSVLNRDVSNFGKNHLTDGRPDTCWNSDQGTPQWICLDFSAPAAPSEIHLQFQGGFAGKEVRVETASSSGVAACCDVFPEDSNALFKQKFSLELDTPVERMRIVFCSSTDMFGRIVLYHLAVYGKKCNCDSNPRD
ncbi:nuclear receptor 2C2-associated protein [Rhipicephalus sanguineus]|uniref:nuclear receptor 2C2-associated protein n=1 Tax=Rhipicephalus sanguineus TaxID=34632 RepID=UPI0020C47124|nr:nuclear receptor 2C2-associated protein [Rhipicephalus sanguineus]